MYRVFVLLKLLAMFLLVSFHFSCVGNDDVILDAPSENKTVLFNKFLDSDTTFIGFTKLGKSRNFFTNEGLWICDSIILDKQYSLSEREIIYKCKFQENTIAEFSTTRTGIVFTLDVPSKTLFVNNTPHSVGFIKPNVEYFVIIDKTYQRQSITIKSMQGQEVQIDLINDGPGGCGRGVVNSNPTSFAMSNGSYKLSLRGGNPFLCSSINVSTPYNSIVLILYGDSISNPESYFPSKLFSLSWTQLIRNKVPLTISSGTGGGTIDVVFERMKSELPYLDVKNVMITIGTNGGNTIEKLSKMIEFLLSLNINPILNHIPCNEGNNQIEVNKMIDIVREKYGITGADFDKATSIDGNGLLLDRSLMFWEDYGPDYILQAHDYWHHPNEKGSRAMYKQFCEDVLDKLVH